MPAIPEPHRARARSGRRRFAGALRGLAAATVAIGLAIGLAIAGCGSRGGADHDAGAAASSTDAGPLEHAMALTSASAPAHADLTSTSEAVGARAVAEGENARGGNLALLAATLRLRAYRNGSDEGDARRAMDWLTLAAGSPTAADACQASLERATLIGELAHDARVTYRELWTARRRLGEATEAPGCAASIDERLALLAPYRPSAAVLESIDRALLADGVVGKTEHGDAGAIIADLPPAHIVRVSRWTTNDSARVVVELDRPVPYALDRAGDRAADEEGAGTLRVRLEEVDLATSSEATIAEAKGLLLRGGFSPVRRADGSKAAIASLTLARPAYRRVFFLPDPFRLVIDLSTTPPPTAAEGSGPRPLRRLVIDAGHGGADPGAIGPTGLREKDVTLAIAKEVAPVVARELGAEVRLTRASDSFVSLEERAAAANAFEADVFLSIHCNSAGEARGRRGVETYVLDTARDEIGRRVAARENGGGDARPGELRAILDDLKLAELGGRSHHLAELIQKATMASLAGAAGERSYADVPNGGVHGAGFFVLVGARMPAVLMEVSFISNPTEESYLASRDYQRRVADALINALRAYRDGT
jgi:N-acetylmuramoyl-L-alanine amidase